MKRRFSLVVYSTEVVPFQEQGVLLGEGLNAFSVSVEDIDAFVAVLKECGVRVDKVYPLDEFEPVPPLQLGHDELLLGSNE